MTARVAGPDDVPALVRLINEAYQVEQFFLIGERTNQAGVQERLTRANGCFLVIDRASMSPVGVAPDAHEDDPQDERSGASMLAGAIYVEVRGHRGFFAMLSVDPRHQKRGLGRFLVTAAEEHCRAAGCRFLDLDVVNVREELPGFYKSLGFAPYGTAPFHDPAKLRRPAHLILMTKALVDTSRACYLGRSSENGEPGDTRLTCANGRDAASYRVTIQIDTDVGTTALRRALDARHSWYASCGLHTRLRHLERDDHHRSRDTSTNHTRIASQLTCTPVKVSRDRNVCVAAVSPWCACHK